MRVLLKYLFTLTGVFIFHLNVHSQTKALEDLKLELKNSKHDTTLVKNYNLIGEELYTSLPDSAMAIWERGIKLAEKNIASEDQELIKLRPVYKKHLALLLSNISYIYYQRGELQTTLENLKRSLRLNEELNNKKGIALSLNALGYLYDSFG